MKTAILIVSIIVLVLSIAIGNNLYKGGKQIDNHSIKMAGFYWLVLIGVSVLITMYLTKGFGLIWTLTFTK